MRVRLVLLLAAAAFYTNAEVDSVATDSTPSTATSRHLRAAEKDDAHVQRFLRFFNFSFAKKLGMSDDVTQNPGAMLTKLEPNVKQQALLTGDNFKEWMKYAKTYKGSSNDPDGHVVDLLRTQYTDVQLKDIIEAAMMSKNTKTFAVNLNKSFSAKKVMENGLKKSYADMKFGDKLDETAVMKWLQDVDRIDNRATLHVLLSLHKESDVFKMLLAAQEKGSAVAKRFMKELSERWKLRDDKPKAVFVNMMLHQDESFLTSKALKIWEDYATDYTRRHKGKEMNQLELLSTYLGDADLFRILAVAKKSKSKDMAEKLQQEWVNSLLNDKVLPSEALGKLFPGEKLADLTNPNWRVWFEYVERFHKTTKYEDMVYTKREKLIDSYRLVWKKLEKAKKQTNADATTTQSIADATKMQDDLLDSLLSADFTTTSVRRIIEGTNHKKFIAYHEEYDKKHKAVLRAKHPI